MILLLPVAQCCTIRYTTLRTLLNYHNSPTRSLGNAMRHSMATDVLHPVLLDTHLDALDRRVKLILQAIGDCLETRRASEVVIDDGF